LAVVLAALAPSTGGAGTTTGPVASCQGEEATIIVEPGEASTGDPFLGTQGDDVIVGSEERDSIRGLKGNDLICGGPNEDDLNGGHGRDELYGETDNDLLRGRFDRDVMNGGSDFNPVRRGNESVDKCRGEDPKPSKDNKVGDVAFECEQVNSALNFQNGENR
jgi:Ca2+-binding RTX toxin-like protein